MRQETDGEDENDESGEGGELDAWAGCVTPTKNTSRLYHAQSGVKDMRPQKGSAASDSDGFDDGNSDKFDDGSSGYTQSERDEQWDDYVNSEYVNESER